VGEGRAGAPEPEAQEAFKVVGAGGDGGGGVDDARVLGAVLQVVDDQRRLGGLDFVVRSQLLAPLDRLDVLGLLYCIQ